ncbi:MAG: glycosyltransferase [Deltaproteobacteria bacterium]|jgi:glycosyltransferase involved in cell wall biosynthesis|nr:glycosyltransferase [Deltaproteobacteria bacterium]
MKISVVIPTFNEEQAIGDVVRAVPVERVHEIIVVDNGSSDDTAQRASAAGARVIQEPRPGYGSACLAGANAAAEADVIVFLDGDRSDDPKQLPAIAGPVLNNRADLVIGSRITGVLEKGAMPLHGRLGNRFIAFLLRLLYGAAITDIGSFRAIKAQTLRDLNMEQMTYGWPVEMVVKAARSGLKIQSVPINYRKRIGESKVTGTVRGSILAAYYMFMVPMKYLFIKLK